MKNWIPKWVEIADWINTCEFETVSTSVSVRVGSSVSAFSVEWLMDVSNIMNQKSKVEAISKIPWDCSLVGNWFLSLSIFQSTDKFSLKLILILNRYALPWSKWRWTLNYASQLLWIHHQRMDCQQSANLINHPILLTWFRQRR